MIKKLLTSPDNKLKMKLVERENAKTKANGTVRWRKRGSEVKLRRSKLNAKKSCSNSNYAQQNKPIFLAKK